MDINTKSFLNAGIDFLSNSTNCKNKKEFSANYYLHNNLSLVNVYSSTRSNSSNRFSLEELKQNKRKLQRIRSLQLVWNGYDGEPIRENILLVIDNYLADFNYQPQIFPTGRGTIQLEYFIDDENFLEMEIGMDDAMLYQSKEGKELETTLQHSQIKEYLNNFYS